MKFLIDAQLPPKLSDWLKNRGFASRHMIEIPGGLITPDEIIWKIAKENDEIIVSKDSDFFDKSLLEDHPPQLLRINLGNCSNQDLFARLERDWEVIEESFVAGCRLVSVSATEISVFE